MSLKRVLVFFFFLNKPHVMGEPTRSFSPVLLPNKGVKGSPKAPVGKVKPPGLSSLGGRLSLAQGQHHLKGQLVLLRHCSRLGTSMRSKERVLCRARTLVLVSGGSSSVSAWPLGPVPSSGRRLQS